MEKKEETPAAEQPAANTNGGISLCIPQGFAKTVGVGDNRTYGTVAEDGAKTALEVVITATGVAVGAALVVAAVKGVSKLFD